MAEYLTELAYQRWYNRYQVNHQNCLRFIDSLRGRLEALPSSEETLAMGDELSNLEIRLDKINPRNFTVNGDPLLGAEKFIENIQVLCNLIFRVFRKNDLFPGIYQTEMNRVVLFHQGFKIKEELQALDEKISALEANQVVEDASLEIRSSNA